MYITALRAISAQASHEGYDFIHSVVQHTGNKYMAVEPSYSGLIRASMLRRMGKSIRIGIGAGMPLLQEHASVDGILIGSSDGGLEDCIKFLNQIVDYEEGTLTPTNFVQSTPNALAGHLALMHKNTGYNITHVHKGLAFDNCMIDALMLFAENKVNSLLIGNVEEISDYNFNIETLAGQFKSEDVSSDALIGSNTEGTVCGEGASMFIVERSADDFYAQIVDVAQISNTDAAGVSEMISELLSSNGCTVEDIDALVLGYNGDSRTDDLYDSVSLQFPYAGILSYKNLVGEYPTSSAFAVYMSANIIAGKGIAPEAIIREVTQQPKKILIYNHFKGLQHSAILMSC